MTTTLIDTTDVTFSYAAEPVMKQVSVKVGQGDFIGVIGPNGSGKSTLLKLLGGMLPCDSGSVRFKGTDIGEYKRKTLARSIAWVPQEHAMVFPFRVQEIIMMGRHPHLSALTFEGEKDFEITGRAMELTDTTRLQDRRFNEISGGEKQRVMMAGALAQEPELMLLDEPTSSLDLKYQMEILNILNRLNRESGLTLVIAIHDLHLASKFCNRLVLLEEGRVVRDGPPQDVLQKEILESVYGVQVKLFHDEEDGSILISPGP